MKELQNVIQRHFEDPKQRKRYMAVLIALSMLVSFMVPLILMEPADSMTRKTVRSSSETYTWPNALDSEISGTMLDNYAEKDGNVVNGYTYSPAQMDLFTLLFGATVDENGELVAQDWYAGKTNLDDALDAEKAEYFLGYASDFCAFIEGDFTATEADAEGRVAVGGDLVFTKDWNYQIGSGDYVTMKPLGQIENYDEYDNIYGFASALVGGKMVRINTLSTGYGHGRTSKDSINESEMAVDDGYHAVNRGNQYAYTVFYNPDEGLYKYFIVGNIDDSEHYSKSDTGEDIPYLENLSSEDDISDCTHDYPGDCILCASGDTSHSYLGTVNELAQMYQMPEGYSVKQLIQDTFTYVRTRSDVLSQIDSIHVTPNGGSVTFDASGKVAPDAKTVYFSVDNWSGGYDSIEFKGIPKGANVVVNCNNSGVVYAVGKENNGKVDVKTVLNGETISNKDGPGNNNPESSRILYNFPNASEIHINGNFNGTILAPNADAKSKEDECTGHLSGALIAKSFKGGLEFGYRPYRGGNDILGITSGYEIPVEKLIAGSDTYLPGAMFSIMEIVENSDEKTLSIFESIKGVNYVSIPSDVDFSGNTFYMPETIVSEDSTRETSENKTANVTIVKPLEITAYDLNGDAIALDSNFNVGDTIVLKANQPVEWGAYGSQEIDATSSTENDVYSLTIKIKKPLTTDGSVGQYNFSPKISGVDSTQKNLSISVNSVVFNVPESFTLGEEITASVSGVSATQIEYFVNDENSKIGEGLNPITFTPNSISPKIIAKITTNHGDIRIEETINAKTPELIADPSTYTVGNPVKLSVTNVTENVTIEYSYSNGNNTGITLDDDSKFIPDRTGTNQIKAVLKINNKEVYTCTTNITGNAPNNMSLEVTPSKGSYVVGENSVTMKVTNVPVGAKICYYFDDVNNSSYEVTKVTDNTDVSYTFKPIKVSNNIQLKADVYLKDSNGNYSKVEPSLTGSINGVLPDNITLSSDKTEYTYGDEVKLTLSGVPDGFTVKFYQIINGNPNELQRVEGTTCTFTPTQPGEIQVKADVYYNNTKQNSIDYKSTFTVNLPDMSISVPDQCTINNNVTLSVTGAPNGSNIKYTIQGPNNDKYNNSSFTPRYAGEYIITATVSFNNVSKELTKTINVTDPSAAASSLTEAVTFSLRRGLNRLSAEGEQETYTITAPDGKTIENIKLNTSNINNNNNYTIKVTFYDSDDVEKGSITVDNSNINNVISCPENADITKIVIEAVKAAVMINSYDVTYTEPCKSVTKTAPFEIEENEDHSYDIILDEDWMNHLDGLSFTLHSNAANPNAEVDYWLYKYENGNYQAIGDTRYGKFENGVFTVSGINQKNVARITIKPREYSYLPIQSYSITALTDAASVPTLPEQVKVLEHEYIIEEIEPPKGFFKSDDEVKYQVLVSETIDLDNVYNDRYPTVVDTNITVNKIDGETTTETYSTKLRISYGLDGTEVNRNIRIIEVLDDDNNVQETFELYMTLDTETNKQKVTSITYNENTTITVPTEAGIFKIDDKSYYFNPDTIMIVPMPETNVTFENNPGLHFKKVDENGDSVKNVTITLTPSTNNNGESLWSWDEETSEQIIDVSKLDIGTTYCISETDSSIKYTKAPDIYFKYDGSKVYYGASADQLNNELDLIENRVIVMVNKPLIGGTEIELEKLDENGSRLDGAIFALYASDGTLIQDTIVVENGLTKIEFGEDVSDKYVEDNLLKVGEYYLLETKMPELDDPNKWYKNPGRIYFRVYYDEESKEYKAELIEQEEDNSGDSGSNGDSGNSGNNGDSGNNGGSTETITLTVKNGSAWEGGPWAYWLVNNGESMAEKNETAKIENVSNVYVVLTKYEGKNIDLYSESWATVGGESINFKDKFSSPDAEGNVVLNWNISPEKDLTQFKIFGNNIVVAYVKITTTDGEYVFTDPSYTPAATASLEDETAVIDETDESTESGTDGETGTESGESTGTEGETGTESGESTGTDGETGTESGDNNESGTENTSTVNTLTITNVVDNNERDVNVEKRWAGDTGFEELRSSVTVTLYQSTYEIPDISALTPEALAAMQPKDKNGNLYENNTIVITEDNNGDYKGKFTGLPTKYRDNNGEYKDYYYYIIEAPVDGYTRKEYSQSGDGTLTVENELDTVSVDVEKSWNGEGTKPSSIKVQLQVKMDDTWKDVTGKTLTLTESSNWTGQLTGLAPGYEYRLTESSVSGWELKSASEIPVTNGGEKLTITNKKVEVETPTGSLSILKLWENAQDYPAKIYVKLYRKIKTLWPDGQPTFSVYDADGNITTVGVVDDYARLLQYSLYFYDANMCGDDVSESSAYSWRNNCHTDDEIVGGYHDAGDHAMFGLPQGYSASMLGWNFYEFNTSVDDPDMKVYDKLGQTNHIKLILDRFCDYFVESVKYENGDKNNQISEILVQKGAGNPDHQYWGAPELQETRMDSVTLKDDGRGNTGWTNGERTLDNEMFWVSNSGADIASEYAAALALQYLNFRSEASTQEEIEKYENYLTVAKKLYQFALAHPTAYNEWGVNKDETATHKEHPGFYASESCDDDIALAAAWLYLATKEAGSADSSYLSKVKNSNSSWAFSWNDVNLAAACANAHITQKWDTVKGYVSNYANKGESYYSQDGWGSARYNAIAQFATLAVAKNIAAKDSASAEYYSNWAKSQMTILLGNNNWGKNNSSVCLITGFTENSTKNAHHRAASGWDSLAEYKVNSTYDIDSHKLLGALVGGPSGGPHNEEQMINYGHTNLTSDEHGDYVDDLHDYCCNEVSLDYQAGLVGAAAGLYYFYRTGELYEIPGVKTKYLPAEEEPEPEAVTTSGMFSSRFSNAYSILSAGYNRLATEGTENKITLSDHFTIKFGDSYSVEELCAGKRITAIELVFSKSSSGNGAILLNGNRTSITASGDRLYLENSDFANGIPGSLTQIAVMQDGITYDSTLTNIILHFEIPLIITSDKYYLDRNEEFSVDISGHTGDIEWNFDDAPGFSVSPTDNTKLIASGTAGKYTIVGTGSGKTDKIYVEVLPAGTKAYKTSLDWNTENISVPDSLKSYEIKRVALKFDKQSSNGSFQVGIDNSSNSYNFSDVPASLYYDIASSVTTKVNVKANYNPDNVVLESMYFIYKVSGNLTINPDTMNVIKGETIDIPVSGANGNVEWVAYHGSNAVNDITFNGNSLTAGNVTGEYTITGTDEDGKEGTFTLIVEEFRITSDEQIELTEGDANGTVVEANAEAEWSIPEQYADYITITPADGKTSKITVNATDFTTDEIVLTAKYNEETTDTIRIQINAGELNFMSGNSFKVHVGETTEIGFNLPKGVTISGNDTSIAEIVNDGNVWKIKGISKGNTTFAAIRGNEINGTIEVIDSMTIYAPNNIVLTSETLQLEAINNVGAVQWSVNNSEYATIGADGILRPIKPGSVTVTATDADGTIATYPVTIQLGSVDAGIPQGAEYVTEIELTPGEIWEETIENLPITDENGNYYCYYIVECDDSGQPITNSNPIRGTGNSTYIPTDYENGEILEEGEVKQLSVTNTLYGKAQGQMPSSGGIGRTTYYFFGGMIMLLSAAGYVSTRRRQSSRREE